MELHQARRLALPAAKQKDEEEGGSEILTGARCLGAVPLKSSLKLGMPLKRVCVCEREEHSKN